MATQEEEIGKHHEAHRQATLVLTAHTQEIVSKTRVSLAKTSTAVCPLDSIQVLWHMHVHIHTHEHEHSHICIAYIKTNIIAILRL